MNSRNFLLKICLFIVFFIIVFIVAYLLFYPILSAKSLIFPFAIHPFDIVEKYPSTWIHIKIAYFICLFFASLIVFFYFSNKPFCKYQSKENSSFLKDLGLNLMVRPTSKFSSIYSRTRFVSKYFNYWNYWYGKNFFCYVSFYRTASQL